MSTTEHAAWRSPALGASRELDLPQGPLTVFEAGAGPPIVFVHGLLVNANLWRKVVRACSPPTSGASRSTCRSARTSRPCGPTRTSAPRAWPT